MQIRLLGTVNVDLDEADIAAVEDCQVDYFAEPVVRCHPCREIIHGGTDRR